MLLWKAADHMPWIVQATNKQFALLFHKMSRVDMISVAPCLKSPPTHTMRTTCHTCNGPHLLEGIFVCLEQVALELLG